jgi:hypothetical protein
MQIGMIEGATRVIGKSQGYMGLPLKDFVYQDGTPAMESVWFPTPKELEALALGAPVVLQVLGTGHPPVSLSVGNPPEVL